MRPAPLALAVLVLCLIASTTVRAQGAQTAAPAAVPRVITFTGVFQPADGQPPRDVETITLALYAEPTGGAPLWQETQSVAVDAKGRYALLLGATSAEGIPPDVLTAGAKWLGTTVDRPGEVESPRVQFTSVPYTLRAADADTLGGRPASAYLLAPSATPGEHPTTASATGPMTTTAAGLAQAAPAPQVVLPGTVNALAKYVTAADVGNSALVETNGALGIGTGPATPFDALHIRINNPNGTATGLAVQNLGNTPTSYSGMLFYDQNNNLAQFQGFNNVTHEYRINNIASNASINFLTGSVSRFLVDPFGSVGIGTTGPAAPLEVSNFNGASGAGVIFATTFTNAGTSLFVGRRARGTGLAPTAVLSGDTLVGFLGQGYGTTRFSGTRGGMFVQAAENWTDAAQGTRLNFQTTATGTITQQTRMTIDQLGNLGIGTTAPSATVEAVRDGDVAVVGATSFGNGCCAGFVARMARGTAAAPAAVQLGDALALFQGDGYGATQFSSEAGGMGIIAAENWTDTAHGTAIGFSTTPLGSTDDAARMAILPNGSVGIGTFTNIPTIADKLQVFGDIRVGTTGTNGCVRRFDGNFLVGTCASDRRFKQNITPFGPVLDHLTALQPVHYYWRTAEFPERHFGDAQAYGLIAQDVEQVLPELVVTNDDGYKAVDYSKLPLLTIQAVKELNAEVKELKAENDALKQRVAELDPLKQRVAELERLLTDLVAKQR